MKLCNLTRQLPAAFVALVLPFASCKKVETKREAEFNGLLDKLKPQFHLRESKFVGDRIVIVFSDNHSPKSMQETEQRIKKVQKMFPYQLFGFEGLNTSSEEERKRRDERIKRICETSGEPVVSDKELAYYKLEVVQSTKFHGDHSSLKNSDEFEKVGLEKDSETFFKLKLFSEVRFFFHEAALAASGDPRRVLILGVNGKRTSIFHRFIEFQKYLKNDPEFSDMPTLIYDLKSAPYITPKTESGETFELQIIDKSNLPIFQQAAKLLGTWIQENMIYGRNKIAAEVIDRHMSAKGLTDAGLVFGLLHTIDNSQDYKSVQSYLADRGISYIVIDPFPLIIKRDENALRVQIGK